jgi:hypothetical protein
MTENLLTLLLFICFIVGFAIYLVIKVMFYPRNQSYDTQCKYWKEHSP